ncbi:hypothetical protein LTR62_007092 [Meristemomyces frigidus]|uniref:DUF7732 domain-containing protein n=1 Tax=Meristemomyces frigidus TaxID=1508187 RepID=A0AAN7YDV0_9PEZI|nr:hypothetical protein LTR62_007092 [Meristemomyces frigidus]
MRTPQFLYLLLGFVTLINALVVPTSLESLSEATKELFKRKGGGGGGKGGGSSSGSSSGSHGSGSSGTTSSGGGSRGGVAPSYGGGQYYGGGARTPYSSGGRSPGGVAPYFLGAGALAFFPGIWLYGAYAYPYSHPYTYYNQTNSQNETHPVQCLCGQYQQCGCDDNNSTDYLNSVANNNTIAKLANVNGTQTLVVNGTLSNDTTADSTSSSGATGLGQGLVELSGFWVVAAGVAYTMLLM